MTYTSRFVTRIENGLGRDLRLTNALDQGRKFGHDPSMGFNKRQMADERRRAAEKEAAARRATVAQVLEDAERLIAAWNERQAQRMPMLFSPTIGAAIAARQWYLWVYCPACRTTNAIDLRTVDRHPDASVTALIPSLSCRACRPNAPFAQLIFEVEAKSNFAGHFFVGDFIYYISSISSRMESGTWNCGH
jgi:hypothetical protein